MKIPRFFKSRTFAVIALMVGTRAAIADWDLVPTELMNPTIRGRVDLPCPTDHPVRLPQACGPPAQSGIALVPCSARRGTDPGSPSRMEPPALRPWCP